MITHTHSSSQIHSMSHKNTMLTWSCLTWYLLFLISFHENSLLTIYIQCFVVIYLSNDLITTDMVVAFNPMDQMNFRYMSLQNMNLRLLLIFEKFIHQKFYFRRLCSGSNLLYILKSEQTNVDGLAWPTLKYPSLQLILTPQHWH